jgi:hypothetical protein
MAEVEAAETHTAELTKAEQKKKDAELTPAELLAFGILPPEPDKLKLAKSQEPGTPGETAAISKDKD